MPAKPSSFQAGPPPLVWAELILLGALWGGSFFFAKIAVAEISPYLLALLRVGFASIALIATLGWVRRAEFGEALARWPEFMVLGLLNNAVPFTLIYLGQTKIGAGLAAILNATTPLWTALVAHALTSDDRLTASRITGVMLGIAGVIFMTGYEAFVSFSGQVWAMFAVVGATISYAFGAIYARRFRSLKPQVVATGQLTAASLAMLPVLMLGTGVSSLFSASIEVWMAVLALALVSTAFAYNLYFDIINKAGATNATLVTLIIPVFAILLGAVFLGERLEITELAGMALIGLGLIVFDGRLLRILTFSQVGP